PRWEVALQGGEDGVPPRLELAAQRGEVRWQVPPVQVARRSLLREVARIDVHGLPEDGEPRVQLRRSDQPTDAQAGAEDLRQGARVEDPLVLERPDGR